MWQLFLDYVENRGEWESREDFENFVFWWSNEMTEERGKVVRYYTGLSNERLKDELGIEFVEDK